MTSRSRIESTKTCLTSLIQPGDRVVCGQVCAEPLTLSRRLIAEYIHSGKSGEVFVGTLFSNTFTDAPRAVRFLSYGAIGQAVGLADQGRLDILPMRYSNLPALFSSGKLRADVVMLQAAERKDGKLSFGLSCDYTLQAARHARTVIVEVNPKVPWTHGTPWPDDLRVDHWIQAEHPPLELPAARTGATEQAIAEHVAGLIPNGATLQVGVGALPDATLRALRDHRALGLHSGVLGDAGVHLIQNGAIDNSQKGRDVGVSVANTVCASAASYAFLDDNPAVEVRHSDFTHRREALSHLANFHAINGALEVDLGGQVNSEKLNGRAIGGVGGLLDFTRAAMESHGGRSIIVMPATAAGGRFSRIVPTLSGPATIGRADVDVIVTEYGVADLRNATLLERARRLIAIAAPQFRDELLANL